MIPRSQGSACLFWVLALSSFSCTTVYLSMCTVDISEASPQTCVYIEGFTVTFVVAFLCAVFWYCYKQKMRYGTHLEYYLHPLPLFADSHETGQGPNSDQGMTKQSLLQDDLLKPLTIENTPEDFECPICNDTDVSEDHQLTELTCKHVFHRECVLKWFMSNSKKTCPICRTSQSPEGRVVVITIIPQEGRLPMRLTQL